MDKTFAVFQTFFKKKYDLYTKLYNSPINIITSPLDSMCLKFNNSNKLKLQYGFTTPWNLEKNIVAYFSFLKNNQDKLLTWKVTCADAATVVQDVFQMEVSN